MAGRIPLVTYLALYLNCGWGIWSTCKQRGSWTVGTNMYLFSCSCDHCQSDQDQAGFVVQGVICLMGHWIEKNIREELRLTIVKLLGHVKQTCVEYIFQVHLLDRKWEQTQGRLCRLSSRWINWSLCIQNAQDYQPIYAFLHVVVNDFL